MTRIKNVKKRFFTSMSSAALTIMGLTTPSISNIGSLLPISATQTSVNAAVHQSSDEFFIIV